MNPNREKTIKMIESTGMMPVVREIAERFGNEGRLPSVAIRQGNDWAFTGIRPTKTTQLNPFAGETIR